MKSSIAKIISAGFALVAPFAAGLLVADGLPLTASILVMVVGLGVGFVGLGIFCSIDTAEEVTHLRRLNPGLLTDIES